MANLGDGLQVNPTSPQTGRSGARNNWMPSLRFGRSSLMLNQPLSTLPHNPALAAFCSAC
jgi:hypothetical protein